MKENGQKIGINTKDKEVLITKDELTTILIALRDDWSRDYGSRSYSREDGRSQWFIAVAVNLSNAKDENIIPEPVKVEVDHFLDWYTGPFKRDYQYPVVNDSSDIGKTEDLINNVLKSMGVDIKNIDPKKVVLNDFLRLRYDWSDVIPDKFVHSDDGMYKIRGNWLLGIAIDLGNALKDGFLSEKTVKGAEDYIHWWMHEYGSDGTHKIIESPLGSKTIVNTQADIDRGNKILDIVLKDLGFEQKT